MNSCTACLSADCRVLGAKACSLPPLAKRHTKLVTFSHVIMANPPHLDQGPSTRPAPAWVQKDCHPCQAVSSDGPTPAFPLVRLFPTKRVADEG